MEMGSSETSQGVGACSVCVCVRVHVCQKDSTLYVRCTFFK